MLKKIIVSTLLVGLIGILVFGAVNRTLDRTGKVAEAQGQGGGRGRSLENVSDQGGLGRSRVTDATGGNGGFGRGAGAGSRVERQYPNYEAVPETWETVEGTVVQAPQPGVELVVETSAGEQLVIGTGPMDWAAADFVLTVDEPVRVQGYWDSGEFKAIQVTRLTTGQTLTLRDEFGQPTWAGRGGNAQGSILRDQAGTGQAQVTGWIELQGTVVQLDANSLIVQTIDGDKVSVENRAWSFAQEQGFAAQVGDKVTLIGFYEATDPLTGKDDQFEVGRIDNVTDGQTVLLRDENGRPMWAGRGGRGA